MIDISIFPDKILSAVIKEGIKFNDCTFIEIYFDGEPIQTFRDFEEWVVSWRELKKSLSGSGQYDIFNCYCGIPEDAGCEPIVVTHKVRTIEWTMDSSNERYIFSKKEYIDQIKNCEKLLDLERFPLAI